jgi:plastocyanin
MMRRGLVVLTIGLFGALTMSARAAPPVGVSIHGRAYDPATVEVPIGTSVRWTNDETGILAPNHTVTADDGSFDSGPIQPGGSYHVRFNRAGTFAYHCEIHPTMHGTVIVDGRTSSPTPTASPTPTRTATAKPTPTPTPSRSRKRTPKPTTTSSAVAEDAPKKGAGLSSSDGTIISVAIIAISVLIGLGYVVYVRFLRAPN